MKYIPALYLKQREKKWFSEFLPLLDDDRIVPFVWFRGCKKDPSLETQMINDCGIPTFVSFPRIINTKDVRDGGDELIEINKNPAAYLSFLLDLAENLDNRSTVFYHYVAPEYDYCLDFIDKIHSTGRNCGVFTNETLDDEDFLKALDVSDYLAIKVNPKTSVKYVKRYLETVKDICSARIILFIETRDSNITNNTLADNYEFVKKNPTDPTADKMLGLSTDYSEEAKQLGRLIYGFGDYAGYKNTPFTTKGGRGSVTTAVFYNKQEKEYYVVQGAGDQLKIDIRNLLSRAMPVDSEDTLAFMERRIAGAGNISQYIVLSEYHYIAQMLKHDDWSD